MSTFNPVVEQIETITEEVVASSNGIIYKLFIKKLVQFIK